MRPPVLILWIACRSIIPLAGTSLAGAITDPGDRQLLEMLLDQVEKLAADCTVERMREFAAYPEEIAWRASKLVRMPLVACRLTGEPKYLDQFVGVAGMDAICACLEKGPDGFLDWYGKPKPNFRRPDRPEQKVAVQITGLEMSAVIAEFACLVQSEPGRRVRYAQPLAPICRWRKTTW